VIEEDIPDDPLEKLLILQNAVISHATDGSIDSKLYSKLRREILGEPGMASIAPQFLRNCRDPGSLWEHFKKVASGPGSYAARRTYIYEVFQPALDFAENTPKQAGDSDVSLALSGYDGKGVREAWEKALDRRSNDPEGAITSARTLLEEVCKHVLEDHGIEAGHKWDLPKLYSETAQLLNLAPSQHTEEVFKKILGGCHTVVENLGSLRNKVGDVHAHGPRKVKPAPRHAALAVNLAGAMAMFLIETSLEGADSD